MKNKKTILLAVLAAVIILAAGTKGTWAYFTTYASAHGGITLQRMTEIEIHERVGELEKNISLTADEGSAPAYVRARAYTGSDYTLAYSGEGWTDGGDGWWYYNEPLAGGETTSELNAKITVGPEDPDPGDNVNIAVIFESTEVLYEKQEDGTFKPYANWNEIQDSGSAVVNGGNGTSDGGNGETNGGDN